MAQNRVQKRKVRVPSRKIIDYAAGILGRNCRAVLGGTVTNFKALYSEEHVVETAHDGEVLVTQKTLHIQRDIADCLSFSQTITVDVGEPEERDYRIRTIRPTSNGDYSDVEIAEITDGE